MKKQGWNLENTYMELPEFFYSKINLKPVKEPQIRVVNEDLGKYLGLDPEYLKSPVGMGVFAGNSVPPGAVPFAQAYAGHQFGYFTMLGDGRALNLGEQITPSGERYDIQLKGSGRTPYSRGGDGRAALKPMLREYIISEAMHKLKVPTTRSLAVVTTGEPVVRDQVLKGSILTRVARSHIRVGTFQYALYFGSPEYVRVLADYTIKRHFNYIANIENPYLSLLKEEVKLQAHLIAKWQLLGFIHGVMNTDNMAISGETIDYGPCAFMDAYNPDIVFSSIDTYGRYAYKKQPEIALWNLSRFAETLLPLIHENEGQALILAQEALSNFYYLYEDHWLSGMRKKLGLFNEEGEDKNLAEELLDIMHRYREDYTNTFINLTFNKFEGTSMGDTREFREWYNKYQARLKRQKNTLEEVFELMKGSNPALIPRNHRVEEALSAADEGDNSLMERLMAVLAKPYAHTSEAGEYAQVPPPSFCSYKTFCGT